MAKPHRPSTTFSTFLIAVGFIGILTASFLSIYFGQRRSVISLQQRTEIMELRKTLMQTFKTSDACDCAINQAIAAEEAAGSNFLFDPTAMDGSQSLPVRSIKGCKAALNVLAEGQKLASGLIIEQILLNRITPLSAGDRAHWTADWTIKFSRESMAMQLPPLEFIQKISLEPANGHPSITAFCKFDEEGHKPASMPTSKGP